MPSLRILFLIVAVILFIIAGLGPMLNTRGFNLMAFGLAFFAAAFLVP